MIKNNDISDIGKEWLGYFKVSEETFNNGGTYCGCGSDVTNAVEISEALPKIITKYKIKSMLG